MTKRANWLLIVILGAGCMSETGGSPPGVVTGGGSPGAPSLVGSWGNSLSAEVAAGYNFSADGKYSAAVVRLKSTNVGELETEIGTYDLSIPTQIHFHAAQSTCPTVPLLNYSLFYSWSGTNLVLRGTDSVTSYARITNMGATFSGQFGCFASDGSGTFTPRPITTL